jgi:FAD/FMN-containing dehydrogenase
MTKISVDQKTFNAVIETGNRLAPVAIKLNEFGRGIPHGSCGYVGIGGHAGKRVHPCYLVCLTINTLCV